MMSVTTHRSPGETFAGYTQLEAITCYCCGILFGVPEQMLETARRKGEYKVMFYCPNGHRQGYGDSPLEKAEQKAKLAADRAASERARREQAEASARAQRAAATRARNERDKDRRRATHGVCPAPGCGRTFKQLGRHMAAKHPELVAEHECGS